VRTLRQNDFLVTTIVFSGYDYCILMTVVWVAFEVGACVDAALNPETREKRTPEMSCISICPTYTTESAFVTNV
jgi:hypothetical protein